MSAWAASGPSVKLNRKIMAGDRLRITLAVAGFAESDLDVTTEENQLVVRGRQSDETEREYLHRGIAARQFQESARLAFAQDFEVWSNKAPCLNGLFIPSDGPFMKARIWYKQFYNPRAMKNEFLEQCEGYYVPKGAVPYTQEEALSV